MTPSRPRTDASAAPALRRELGPRGLTLFIITCIVGAGGTPAAAHAGPGSVMLRLLAAVFFVTPLAVAAAALPVKYSGTGGMHDRGSGAGASRLPFAAGVDHLLPAAFAKTHPRRATPHISILAPGVVASFLPVLIQFGDTMRAACQTLVSLMLVAGFLPFVYTFGSAWKAGRRLSAVFGRAITAMAIACSAAPTAGIMHVWLFEGKLAAGRLAVIASAWMVYRRNRPTCS